MRMSFKNILCLIVIFTTVPTYAETPQEVKKEMVGVYYVAQGGESLDDVLKIFNIPPAIAHGKANFAQQVKNLNQTVTQWDSLKRGHNIYIKIPKRFYLQNPPKNIKTLSVESQVKERMKDTTDYYIAYDNNIKKEEILNNQTSGYKITNQAALNDEGSSKEIKNKKANENFEGQNIEGSSKTGFDHLSVFYMASKGSFQETIPGTSLEVSSDQNSPVTLGLSWESYFKNIGHIFSGSVYVSKLTATDFQSDSIATPMEYGVNIYDNFSILKRTLNFYVGFDYEKFSTINSEEIASGMETRALDQSILFATMGFSKSFKLGIPLFAKIGISTSLLSAGTATSFTDETKYSGQKLIIFVEHKINSSFAVDFLFKKHFLTGPTELSINRLGLGFRYSFF